MVIPNLRHQVLLFQLMLALREEQRHRVRGDNSDRPHVLDMVRQQGLPDLAHSFCLWTFYGRALQR